MWFASREAVLHYNNLQAQKNMNTEFKKSEFFTYITNSI